MDVKNWAFLLQMLPVLKMPNNHTNEMIINRCTELAEG
jgi:hypothetical protein